MEQQLDIQEKTTGDKVYYNINLKPKPGKPGLTDGNHVVVEKVYLEGYKFDGKFGPVYSCSVKYKGKQCTFLLNEKEHNKYKEVGGIGDNIKITLYKESFINPKTQIEMLLPKLKFEMA